MHRQRAQAKIHREYSTATATHSQTPSHESAQGLAREHTMAGVNHSAVTLSLTFAYPVRDTCTRVSSTGHARSGMAHLSDATRGYCLDRTQHSLRGFCHVCLPKLREYSDRILRHCKRALPRRKPHWPRCLKLDCGLLGEAQHVMPESFLNRVLEQVRVGEGPGPATTHSHDHPVPTTVCSYADARYLGPRSADFGPNLTTCESQKSQFCQLETLGCQFCQPEK